MLVAYIAGPYRSETIYGIEQNIQRAKRLAAELWKRGYAVICPHANSAFMDGVCDDETFLKGGLELLRRSDFVVVLNGWESSEGTRKELELAKSLGIPIYFEKDLWKVGRLVRKDVLNAGYVELVEYMGGDEAVVRNARRCWRSENRSSEESDKNLIHHLISKEHKTPFEALVFTFDVKCPIFVARQWMRHRIGSYSEESLRYCVAEGEYYKPDDLPEEASRHWDRAHLHAFDMYEYFLDNGLPKEQARSILPLSTYTKFYWTVNASSLMNFLKLRTDEAAQKEIRAYAFAILDIVKEVAPISFSAFEENLKKV